MSQTLIDALDALESQVAALSGAVKTADPVKIGQKAEEGARRGAATAMADIPDTARTLRESVRKLEQALPAAQKAADGDSRVRWLVRGLIALAALLGLLSAFVGGVAYTRSGLTMTTETGCRYLGGQWGQRPEGGAMCWREVQ